MSSRDQRCTVVIPCYNEVSRLDRQAVLNLSRATGVDVVLVDDGSTDGTDELLHALAEEPGITYLSLPENRGKAEAVRQGMMIATGRAADVVGYVDADFSVPTTEVLRLLSLMQQEQDVAGLLGSRVLLAGRSITRSRTRHYLGRMVATYLSSTYGLDVYDTQCGAKFFRNSARLRAAISASFTTRWLFDVELLLRLQDSEDHSQPSRFREEPLEQWTHVEQSKVTGPEIRRVIADFYCLQRNAGRHASELVPTQRTPGVAVPLPRLVTTSDSPASELAA